MTLALQIIALLGLIAFAVFAILYLVVRPARAPFWTGAVVSLLVWAVATIVLTLGALLS